MVKKWWDDHDQDDMENKPAAKYLIVKDVSQEWNGKVVGYAKWWVPIGESREKNGKLVGCPNSSNRRGEIEGWGKVSRVVWGEI